jgi:hypothetical protein
MSPNSQGIDTIQLIAKYETVKKMADKLGLFIQPMKENHRLYKKIADEVEADKKKRLKVDKFTPIIEVIVLPKVEPKDKALYISIIRNTPILFNVADERKTKKDSFCMITFAGLHQPTKKIDSDAIKIISKSLKRKTFKVCRVDFSKDTRDSEPIDKNSLKGFRKRFKAFSKCRVIHHKNSFYIDRIEKREDIKINYYDKYNKALERKEKVSKYWKNWKRLEITLTFDVTKQNSLSFMEYLNSMDFLNDFSDFEDIAKIIKIEEYSNDYLEYQINSFMDNRFMNNRESRKQFNLTKALEHFKDSEFRRYLLPI